VRRFTDEELFRIRNFIPVRQVIEELLAIPGKDVEGVFRFVCPCCYESNTAINPSTNLTRCFLCKKNFNTIEIVMADRKLPFVKAVTYLIAHYRTKLQPTKEQFQQDYAIYGASSGSC